MYAYHKFAPGRGKGGKDPGGGLKGRIYDISTFGEIRPGRSESACRLGESGWVGRI